MASVTRSLLYSDALGEVARLVHVEAPVLGNVVREELQRHATDKGGQDLRRLGNREHQVRNPLCAFVPLAGDGDHAGPPGEGLLDVREGLLAERALSENGYDGTMFVHQCNRT